MYGNEIEFQQPLIILKDSLNLNWIMDELRKKYDVEVVNPTHSRSTTNVCITISKKKLTMGQSITGGLCFDCQHKNEMTFCRFGIRMSKTKKRCNCHKKRKK